MQYKFSSSFKELNTFYHYPLVLKLSQTFYIYSNIFEEFLKYFQ